VHVASGECRPDAIYPNPTPSYQQAGEAHRCLSQQDTGPNPHNATVRPSSADR
jgi:hypothetical protein